MLVNWNANPTESVEGIVVADLVEDICRETVLPELESSAEPDFPARSIRRLAAEGLLGIMTPRELGGVGLDSLNAAYTIEQISRFSPSTGFVLLLHLLSCNRLYRGGTEYHRRRYLPRISRDTLAASAWSETQARGDKEVLQTEAVRRDGHWRISGQKAFCTSAGHAGLYLVMADSNEGKVFLLLEDDNPGLRFGKEFDSMGLQATASGEICMVDAVVPDIDRVGEPGRIGPILNHDMRSGLNSGIVATGLALGAFGRLVEMVKGNGLFDKFESIRTKMAAISATLTVMRSFVYSLATAASNGQAVEQETMTAKWFLSENAARISAEVIQIAGKAGYLRENRMEQFHRDAMGILLAAPINGQILGSLSTAIQVGDRASYLYKVG